MKKIFKLGFMLIVLFMITGCVKMEFTMGINKDKSMDLQIIQAVDKQLLEGDTSSFDMSSLKEAENQGFLVKEYSEGNMQGYVVTKKIDSIDKLSTEESDYVSDFTKLLEESNVYVFSIEKGFLKNTYKAKLKVSDGNMGDLSSMTGGNSSSFEDDNDDYSWSSDEEDDDWSISGSDMDYTEMMKNMEVNFVVNLPYKVIDSNATSVDNDGKKLTWNLMTTKDQTIDFEFELYNMTNVYIVVGAALVVISLVVVVIVKSVGKGKSNKPTSSNQNMVNSVNTYTNTVTNEGNNNFISSNELYNNQNMINNSTPTNNQSNNMFFNNQDLDVNNIQQTIVETPEVSSIPLGQFEQSSNNIVDANINNDANSILTDLNAINFNNTSQPVMPEPVVQPQPVIPEPVVQPQPVISEPVVQPEPVIPEPVVQPQPVIPEPVVQPEPVIPEPVVQPEPVISEPVVQPEPVIPEPVVQPEPVIPEPVVQPQPQDTNKFF